MSIAHRYQQALQQPDMHPDPAQAEAVTLLDALAVELERKPPGLGQRLLIRLGLARSQAPRGLYLWGGVGRGKTWLMNLFFEEVAIQQKLRAHFHPFMLSIHERLAELNAQKRKRKNPLRLIARELAADYRLICIDEFIVTNITDAMILSELLQALFSHGVCLVATSNRVPDDLYLNGLQRERFLPAIALIKQRLEVFHLDGGVDHRSALLEQTGVYHCPVTADTDGLLRRQLAELSISPLRENAVLRILGRDIDTVMASEECVWFRFEVLCSAPRAAQDYLELARHYRTLVLSDIPVLDEYRDDMARRFIYLVDALYDAGVSLICSAAAEPADLYTGTMLEFAFKRTASRLVEMRSHHYLSQSPPRH